jgi:hypothetical protein
MLVQTLSILRPAVLKHVSVLGRIGNGSANEHDLHRLNAQAPNVPQVQVKTRECSEATSFMESRSGPSVGRTTSRSGSVSTTVSEQSFDPLDE